MPLIKAAIRHHGAAFIDVISPCVAFNNHAGSTKSYDYVREHNEAVNRLDFMPAREPITADYEPGTVARGDAARRLGAAPAQAGAGLRPARPHRRDDLPAGAARARGEIVTGLLYVDPDAHDLHDHLNTVDTPLNRLGEAELCPGAAALEAFNAACR